MRPKKTQTNQVSAHVDEQFKSWVMTHMLLLQFHCSQVKTKLKRKKKTLKQYQDRWGLESDSISYNFSFVIMQRVEGVSLLSVWGFSVAQALLLWSPSYGKVKDS